MAQEIAFGAPKAEEMTKTATGLAGAGITGVVQGVIIKMAPQMGAAAPILTWGTLLGAPLIGAAGALFTRGLLGDLFTGVACGGLGVLGYSLPEMIAPITGRRALGGGGQGQLGTGAGIKQLGQGVAEAAQRAQAGIRSAIEF